MRFVRTLLLLLLLALPAYSVAQNTTVITLAHMIANGAPVANAQICASPADANANTISVSSTGWGLVLKDHPFCAQVVNGALPSGLSVPDASHTTSSAAIRYNIRIQVQNANGVATGAPILFNAVPNVTGPTFPLDAYTPTVSTSIPPNGLIYTSGLPSSCTSPSIVIDQTVPAAYMCSNGSLVPLNVATTATHATTADSATTATTATNANYATTAGSATSATSASTATALAATPTVCAAGQLPNGVDVHGNAINCAIPASATHATSADTATSATNATTANALAATPSNCGSQAMTGINANGTPISCIAVGGGAAPLGTQYKIAGYTGAGSGANTALGQTNCTTDATGNPLNCPGPETAQSIGSYDPTKQLGLGASSAAVLDFVVPGTSGNVYPYQNPYAVSQAIDKRYMGNDGNDTETIKQYAVSGGKNFSNQFSGGASLAFEKPDYEILGLWGQKQTAGQTGAIASTAYWNLSKGDTMTHTDQITATGVSDGDDEGLKAERANYSYSANRFGMALTSVTADGIGNWILRGTALSGYTALAAEGLPVLDLSGDLNPSSLGNITDMRPYPADTRFAQLTPDTGINIGTLLGNSTVSFSTSSIAPPVLNAGIVTNYDGTGGLVNATQTVANASGFTASTTMLACIGSVADNFEMTHIISVNTSTNTLTYDYIREQHGTNEMVSQGGGCGYAVAMNADDKAPGTTNGTLSYGGDHGNNTSTLHNAYPILATVGGDLIGYTNEVASGDSYLHTGAYINTTPKVPGTLTPTMSGGAMTALTVQAAADYTANGVFNQAGQYALAYPTLSITGGGCTTEPTATVTGYQDLTGSSGGLHNPILSITNAGAGCTGTPAATMQSTGWANPYHLYPMTMSFKVIDPAAAIDPNTNQHSAAGDFVRTEALNSAKWNVGDNIEISGWWNQYAGSNRTFGKVYGGQSNSVGVRVWDSFAGDWAFRDTLEGLFNSSPSSKYWSASGPAPGRQYEVPPDGYMFGGMLNHDIVTSDVPRLALLSVQCLTNVNGLTDTLSPCHSGGAQTYNIWESFTASNTNLFDYIRYNNGTRTITFGVPTIGFGGATITSTGIVSFSHGLTVGGGGGAGYPNLTFNNGFSTNVPFGLCNIYDAGGPLCVGTPHFNVANGSDNFYAPDGDLWTGKLEVTASAQVNGLSVGLGIPVPYPVWSYSGAAGSINLAYYFEAKNSLGQMTPAGFYISNPSTAALSVSNTATITCPTALQNGYPAGTAYELIRYNISAGLSTDLGTCPLSGNVTDNGSNVSTFTPPTRNATAAVDGGSVAIGGSQFINKVLGTGTEVLTCTGTFPNGHLVAVDANGTCIDGGAPPVLPPVITSGTATLAAGTVTVSTASAVAVSSTHQYMLQNCGASGTAIGTLSVGTVTAGTSFVINSLTATNTVATGDTSTICWWIR